MKWQVGDVTITKIVELEVTGGTRFLLPQATREVVNLPIHPRLSMAEARYITECIRDVVETLDA